MVNKLILGTVQFGLNYGINNNTGKPDRNSVYSMLDYAYTKGVRLLDSAEAYGDAHEVIGAYHASSPNKFQLITKYSAGRKDLSTDLFERVQQNLNVLKCESLYAYMFHSYKDFETYFETVKPAIQQLKKEGLIKRLGVSVYTNEELEQLIKVTELDLVQLPFNLLDNNYQRAALMNKAKQRGMEVHTRSAFLQGLFFRKSNQLPDKLSALVPFLEKINTITAESHIQLNDLALNYVIQQRSIDKVLIGVDTLEQLIENINSLDVLLTPDILKQVDALMVKETKLLNPSNWN